MIATFASVQGLLSVAGSHESTAALPAFIGYGWALGRRCWRAKKIYLPRENWIGLILGAGLAQGARDVEIVRGGALVAAVAAHAMEGASLCCQLESKVKRFVVFCTADPPPIRRITWATHPRSPWLSPSTEARCEELFFRAQSRLYIMAQQLGDIVLLALQLINESAEIVDALCWEPDNRRQNVQELFVNLDSVVDQLVSNGPLLIASLEQRKTVVESVLQALDSPLTADELIMKLNVAVNGVQVLREGVKSFEEGCGEFAIRGLQRGAMGVAASLDCLDALPLHQSTRSTALLSAPYPDLSSICLVSDRVQLQIKIERLSEQQLLAAKREEEDEKEKRALSETKKFSTKRWSSTPKLFLSFFQ